MVDGQIEPNGKLEQDLRRGVLVLATLSQLTTRQYGYSLRQALAERGLPIEEGTLYPLLRRLEAQGLLTSEWRIDDAGPPRRYYELSAQGATVYRDLSAAWGSLTAVMGTLLSEPAIATAATATAATEAADAVTDAAIDEEED